MIPAATVVVEASGCVVHANDLARRRLGPRLLDAIPPEDPRTVASFDVKRLEGRGMNRCYVLVHRSHGNARYERLRRHVKDWSLSRRQTEVLDLVVRGDSNATIAIKLGLRLRTVEQHVTALLQRTGCERRSELTALFWAERSDAAWTPREQCHEGIWMDRHDRGDRPVGYGSHALAPSRTDTTASLSPDTPSFR